MESKRCPNCRGMFSMISTCKVCMGQGYITAEIKSEEPAKEGEKTVVPVVRDSKNTMDRKLRYDTIIRVAMTIEQVVEIFFQAGFDRCLVSAYDDATTRAQLVEALGVLSQDDNKDQCVRLARLLSRLRSIRKELGESTVG